MFYGVLVTFSFLLVYNKGAADEGHVVHTKLGAIAGTLMKIGDNRIVFRFMGVPYAKAPVGPLRFLDPQRITENFKSTLWAKYTFRCLSFLPHINNVVQGYENCLYLNIFTPKLDEDAKYNVIVFFHGGGFYWGANYSQSPDYLLEANDKVVFVAVNYRLGVFGFLSTEDDVVPGNMGLKDQALALEWIHENIKLFGGNPERVTIAGMSAGGISVHLHYFSPLSRNLFAQGISMSGAALSPLVRVKGARQQAEKLAAAVHCPTKNSARMLKCLQAIDGPKLVEVTIALYNQGSPFSMYIQFLPVIENAGLRPFLNEHPFHSMRKGKMKHAPWLVSVTTAEGLKPGAVFADNNNLLQKIDSDWNKIAPKMLAFNEFTPERDWPTVSQFIRKEYLNDEPITTENRDKLIQLIGDRLYVNNIENAVRLHADASNAPVYFYQFDYVGKYSFGKIYSKSKTSLGVSHIDDLIYILKMSKIFPKEEDSAMVETMLGIWSSFVATGVPSTNSDTPWPTVPKGIVDKGDLPYVKIKGPNQLVVTSSPQLGRRDFWDRLPIKELHVTGDKVVPSFIERQQTPGWFHRTIISPLSLLISRLVYPIQEYFSSKTSVFNKQSPKKS